MKKKKLNWKKVIIAYTILIIIFCLLILIIPNYFKYTLLWVAGFLSGIVILTAIIEGGDHK